MIGFLWAHREQPPIFSNRWVLVWGKRCLNAWSLIRVLWRRATLSRLGVKLGAMSYVVDLEINGPGSNLCIGDESFIGRGVHIATHERVSIGSHVVVSDKVTILTASHDVADPQWGSIRRPVRIEQYAWIATSAIILPGVTVGRGAVVGAGAVVAKDVAPYAIVKGSPAVSSERHRPTNLSYRPVRLAAVVDAWLGQDLSSAPSQETVAPHER